MSVSEDLIDFEIIENQKENIQSLPGGRSARGLANLFSSPLYPPSTPTPSDTLNLNNAVRQEYEKELESISESDDPLDIYDRYVRWTLDAYPSAQATPASRLSELLERATKTFMTSVQYKNDPRYLKLWLLYIRLFSETPRETFAFLSRHDIGDGLALFYEEFAAWLEGAGRWVQAEEVYKMGMDKEARPATRLIRKFNEFQERFQACPENVNEPSSPALPTVRPALAAKIDPFAAVASRDPQAPRPSSGVGGSISKSGKQKLTIFSDADISAPAIAVEGTQGWQSIGSLANGKKENVIEPSQWVGETLQAGGKKSSTKIPVFKDESSQYQRISTPTIERVTINPKNRRSEHVFVNLERLYPQPNVLGTELCFEEMMAGHRGWLNKVWKPEGCPGPESVRSQLTTAESTNMSFETITQDITEKLVISQDPIILDENGATKVPSREGRGRRMKIKEVNETQIIKAKLSSPSGKKMTKRKASKEQTMTLHTRAATDEIYDLFSQPLNKTEDEEEDEESDDDGEMTDGDYTSGGESTGTGRLLTTSEAGDDGTTHTGVDDETSDVKSVSEWSDFTARKHIPNMDDDKDEDEDDVTGALRFTGASEDLANFLRVEAPRSDSHESQEYELLTPDSPQLPTNPRPMFVPIPPEDYEAPTRPYRDPSQVSQNRLPFMTPIAEKTESSLGMNTNRADKDYFNSKTPSKNNAAKKPPVRLEGLDSSPFREIINDATPERIAQPQLVKTKKVAPAVKSRPTDLRSNGPIVEDAQCNPVDDYTRNLIFQNLQPPLSTYEGFFDQQNETRSRGSEIKKYAKAMAKFSKSTSEKTSTNLAMPPILQFPGTDRQYMLKRELGAGAFAPVYLVENVAGKDEDDGFQAVMGKGPFDGLKRKKLEAIKMEDPPTAWEFYIMRQAKRRLGVMRAAVSIVNVYEMHLYADECYLIEEFRDQGTLLDIINITRADSTAPGGVMDEILVMFFAIELFRTIEGLHSKGILHGDLKADNCLVRLDQIPDDDVWAGKYRRDGTDGWSNKGIALIDFGRGIDMKVFRPDVQFITDWKTSASDCAEMRELRPWTYQIDYHGLAGIIHSMLFGKYIDTIADKAAGIGAGSSKKWRTREGFKRYWQTEIWGVVFDLLLNPGLHLEQEEGMKMPVLRGMQEAREQMESWLEKNSEKGIGLQASIRKLELAIRDRRK
ncbi:Mad3/BUB1 homology region 1-domain-containing protein [Calycina marina]|uniref:Mad3/BUB1 homology region 1-domain-containing protein n=1 Tax=Calycina marina TaxID=1763456 RepID=A0A9P7Z0Z3_9HELO|nr:Mad3/BUB1 homology region 1-domain-containing protein [Calycina marina]